MKLFNAAGEEMADEPGKFDWIFRVLEMRSYQVVKLTPSGVDSTGRMRYVIEEEMKP